MRRWHLPLSVITGNRIGDSNANVPPRDQVRARGVNVWVPAQKLFDSEGVLVSRDDVPAGISALDSVE